MIGVNFFWLSLTLRTVFFEAATHSWSHQELSNELLRATFDFIFIALHAKVGAKTHTPD
jgi:hypothetical protein